MPNQLNITAPTLLIGPGRTASSYVLEILHLRGDTQILVENTVLMSLRQMTFDSWWSPNWRYVCPPEEVEARLVRLARLAMITYYPSDLANWAYKAIWEEIDWPYYNRIYPDAKYIHLLRDPRSNIASMLDYIGGPNGDPAWDLERCCQKYVDSHRKALEVRTMGLPYLSVRQEDFISKPHDTWLSIFDFLNLSWKDLPFHIESNTAQQTKGRVKDNRANNRLSWDDLPKPVHELAQTLGYSTLVQHS